MKPLASLLTPWNSGWSKFTWKSKKNFRSKLFGQRYCNLFLQCILDCPDVAAVPKRFPAAGDQHVHDHLGVNQLQEYQIKSRAECPPKIISSSHPHQMTSYPQTEEVWSWACVVLLVLGVGHLRCHEANLRKCFCLFGNWNNSLCSPVLRKVQNS